MGRRPRTIQLGRPSTKQLGGSCTPSTNPAAVRNLETFGPPLDKKWDNQFRTHAKARSHVQSRPHSQFRSFHTFSVTPFRAWQPSKKLHIGCGPRRLPGWINADAVAGVGDVILDLHNPNALPHESYREIYGCHVLEHCWPQDTPEILQRLHNSLVPGGTLRLSVPDIRLVVKNCIDGHAYGNERSALSVIYGGEFSRTTSAPDLHRQTFWHERLARLLHEAGFVNVRVWGRGQYPEIDALNDYATSPAGPDGKSLISLNLEANRTGELKKEIPPSLDVSVLLGPYYTGVLARHRRFRRHSAFSKSSRRKR